MPNQNDPQLKYRIGLTLIPGIGSILAKKLVEYTGNPEEVFKTNRSQLEKIPGIGKNLADKIAGSRILSMAEKEIDFITKYRIRALWYLDDNYPQRLRQCPDSPVVLFTRGKECLDHSRIISVVGTRNASSYGLDLCRNLIHDLSAKGYDPLIMSGLAFGIDICAHKTALENRLLTIAALAHGLSTIYPNSHRSIAEKIIRQGALVTDFPSTVLPERGNFIKRNRLIAGMADATIVIESGTKGGALITADLANSYNRDVFAIPGRVCDKRSQGCNNLIKTHRAALLEEVHDLEYILGWAPVKGEDGKTAGPSPDGITENEKSVLLLLAENSSGMSVDRISGETGFGPGKISGLLLDLEFRGFITSMPGKIYKVTDKLPSG